MKHHDDLGRTPPQRRRRGPIKHTDAFIARKLLSRSRVNTNTPLVNGCHCRDWLKGTFASGYASMWDGEQTRLASRLSLRVLGGAKHIKHALHHCDRPICIEPAHLYSGTAQNNRDDAVKRGRVCQGAAHPRAKLDEPGARYIKANPTRNRSEMARELGVSEALVRGVLAGRNWGWI